MAATKAKKVPKKPRVRVRIRRTHYREARLKAMGTPAGRDWIMWNHDFDTILHELVKNPQLADVAAVDVVERAVQFADAIRKVQTERRPAGVDFDGRF